MDIEDKISTILFVIGMISLTISWFTFSYIQVPKIDDRMFQDGKEKVCPVDILGLRTLMIATAIAIPVGNPLNHEHNPFINPKAVRPYATKADKVIALILFLSVYGLLSLVLISYCMRPDGYS